MNSARTIASDGVALEDAAVRGVQHGDLGRMTASASSTSRILKQHTIWHHRKYLAQRVLGQERGGHVVLVQLERGHIDLNVVVRGGDQSLPRTVVRLVGVQSLKHQRQQITVCKIASPTDMLKNRALPKPWLMSFWCRNGKPKGAWKWMQMRTDFARPAIRAYRLSCVTANMEKAFPICHHCVVPC